MSRRPSSSSNKSKSAAAGARHSSIASSMSSQASRKSSLSGTSIASSASSGASVGSWDPRGRASDVDKKHILLNDKIENVAHWYDNASTKPLPGQHRLRDMDGKVITAVKAAEDRKLKEKLRFTGLTGKKNRLTFETVNNAVETVPLRTRGINTLTGERGPWKQSSIQVDRIPDFSEAAERDELRMARQARTLRKPQSILVNGKKVKPSRYYENVFDGRPSVTPLPGQSGIYCQVGNYAEDAVAGWEKHTKRSLDRYVGYQNKGGVKMRAFRTASYDDSMGGVGKPVNFMTSNEDSD